MPVLAALPSPATIQGFKGTLDFYVQRGQALCRKWPRKPNMPRSLPVQQSAAVFADLSRALQTQSDVFRQIELADAAGTSWTWKDVATTAQYDNLYTFY